MSPSHVEPLTFALTSSSNSKNQNNPPTGTISQQQHIQHNDPSNRGCGKTNNNRGGGRIGGGSGRGRSHNNQPDQFSQWGQFSPWAWSPFRWGTRLKVMQLQIYQLQAYQLILIKLCTLCILHLGMINGIWIRALPHIWRHLKVHSRPFQFESSHPVGITFAYASHHMLFRI